MTAELDPRHAYGARRLGVARPVPVDRDQTRIVEDGAVELDRLLGLAVMVATEHQERGQRTHRFILALVMSSAVVRARPARRAAAPAGPARSGAARRGRRRRPQRRRSSGPAAW